MSVCELSLCEAARRIREGAITAEDYCRRLLARCEAGRALNAFVTLDPERVLSAARDADRRRQRRDDLGPLHGVPLVVKDAIDIAGMPTTAGTPALQGNTPARTAPALQPLFEAGAILLGKTNLPELCFAVTGNNECTGAVCNPYDLTFSPGGSSAGTAAAVAARMAPAGLGTDTSGSVRIPAAFCGLVGYRPSTGRYPSAGVVPMNHTRDTVGFMARSVADVVLLDEVCTEDRALRPVQLKGLRIGLVKDYFFADVDDRVASVIDAELARLQDLGVEFVEADAPDFAAARGQITGPVMVSEFHDDLQQYLEEVGAGVSVDEVVRSIASPYVKSALEEIFAAAGPEATRRYEHAISELIPRHRAEYLAYLGDNELAAIAFPTAPLLPGPVGENEVATLNGQDVSIWQTLRNAVPATVVGAPGLTVPVGMPEDRLPVGLELDGVSGGDRDLLALGLAWEQSGTEPPRPGI